MVIKNVMALVLIFQTRHQMEGLTAVCAGLYQIANFISLYCSKDRKQVSLHGTQTGQIDGKVLGCTQEQGSMKSHLETGKRPRCMNTQNLSSRS